VNTKPVNPKARAIILADNVYRDAETGKCIIAGTFNRIGSTRFPAVHPAAALYLNLTDFVGKRRVQVRLSRDQTGETIGEREFFVESLNKLGSCEVTVRLTNLSFPEAGKYSFEVYCEDEYLGHLPIELVLNEESGPQKGG